MRATRSGVAPAPNGTTIRTGAVGHCCALAETVQNRTANAASTARFIDFPLRFPFAA